MADSREHARAPIELKVEYKRLNSFFADYTKNISKGGTFIKTRRSLPAGTLFLFHLAVPGRSEPLELRGEVIHAGSVGGDPGMGIRFIWSDESERRRFESLVEALMSESLGPAVARSLLGRSK